MASFLRERNSNCPSPIHVRGRPSWMSPLISRRSGAREKLKVTDDRVAVAASGGASRRAMAQTHLRLALVQRHVLIDCLASILREMNSNSRTARRGAAGGGDASRLLDFDFISRFRSAMQTMRKSALHRSLSYEVSRHASLTSNEPPHNSLSVRASQCAQKPKPWSRRSSSPSGC